MKALLDFSKAVLNRSFLQSPLHPSLIPKNENGSLLQDINGMISRGEVDALEEYIQKYNVNLCKVKLQVSFSL